MHLREKIKQTVPGQHAVALGDVRYFHGHKLDKNAADKLSAAEAYLERLAIAELREVLREREPWALELLKWEERGLSELEEKQREAERAKQEEKGEVESG